MTGEASISPTGKTQGRRSHRVLLRIPILVRQQGDGHEALAEDSGTLVVNAHGALITLAMHVKMAQKVIVKNLSTGTEQECLVVHIQERFEDKNEVGVAFLSPSHNFGILTFRQTIGSERLTKIESAFIL